MASDPPQSAPLFSPAAPRASKAAAPRVCDKVRVRFRKGGDLRLVSHRDLMKCFERALRRAALPIHVTQGFHPLPRMVFALSLGLGIIGSNEVLELEFDAAVDVDDVRSRLARQMPAGLDILSVARIPFKSSALVRRAGYRVHIPAANCAGLDVRIAELLAWSECWVERTRPQPRRFDLRPFLSELRLIDQRLDMLLWVTAGGTARPTEVLEALGLGDLVAAGVPQERFLLELHDEIHNPGPVPDVPLVPAAADRRLERVSVPERPTPLVPGPLNFDS
jgi:radical SAM-linked protein